MTEKTQFQNLSTGNLILILIGVKSNCSNLYLPQIILMALFSSLKAKAGIFPGLLLGPTNN
jgi:hypothetical protein